jgi:hypothetical protein
MFSVHSCFCSLRPLTLYSNSQGIQSLPNLAPIAAGMVRSRVAIMRSLIGAPQFRLDRSNDCFPSHVEPDLPLRDRAAHAQPNQPAPTQNLAQAVDKIRYSR